MSSNSEGLLFLHLHYISVFISYRTFTFFLFPIAHYYYYCFFFKSTFTLYFSLRRVDILIGCLHSRKLHIYKILTLLNIYSNYLENQIKYLLSYFNSGVQDSTEIKKLPSTYSCSITACTICNRFLKYLSSEHHIPSPSIFSVHLVIAFFWRNVRYSLSFCKSKPISMQLEYILIIERNLFIGFTVLKY